MRARTDITEIQRDLFADLDTLRAHIMATGGDAVKDAWAGFETFTAIALRVMAKTNPSKLRDIARTVEIQTLMPRAGAPASRTSSSDRTPG